MVEVKERERRNEEGTERVFVGRGRVGEGLGLSTGELGGWWSRVGEGPGDWRGRRGVSGWCMQLATWLERTRRNAPGGRGRRAGETKRTVALCPGLAPAPYSQPGAQGDGAHGSTATLNSCRAPLVLHPLTIQYPLPAHMTMNAVVSPSRNLTEAGREPNEQHLHFEHDLTYHHGVKACLQCYRHPPLHPAERTRSTPTPTPTQHCARSPQCRFQLPSPKWQAAREE